jgi:predicted amidophosphoribosyltransferase
MPGYKHPCKYCGKLVSADDNVCPFCGRVNPVGPQRCPKCRNPIETGQVRCSNCGLSLQINCPHCGKPTFFGDYCQNCNQRLTVVCPNCRTEQAPLGEKCIKCGKLLNIQRRWTCHFNLSPVTILTIAPKRDSNLPLIATYAATDTKQASLKAKPTRKKDFGGD